jgi:hypothetical protein
MEPSGENKNNSSDGDHSLPDPIEKDLVFEDAVSGPMDNEQPCEKESKTIKEENPLSKQELDAIAYSEKY